MIYIVEDEENIREIESYALRSSGYETVCFEDGSSLVARCRLDTPQLVVLDIMLPGEDGLTLLEKLKSSPVTSPIPVIIVSAKDSELDAVKGLDGGADDYITKPFGVMEFLSRVKAVLRRSESRAQAERFIIGGIELDDSKHTVKANGADCQLTYKEYKLLLTLMQHHGKVLSREKLMILVWGTDFAGETRTVDMHIKSLRKKLGDCGEMIVTVRNVGYKLEAGAE